MSLALRAVLALVLMCAFYALAIGTVVGLVIIGVLLLTIDVHSYYSGAGALASFVTAAIIAWSILPRRDRFQAPGPELEPAAQPELFAEIRRIAEATGERMPSHVYAAWEVGAFVAQRGGVMGLGSRRVMMLGLPLVRTLTVSELRAVIAHEMGHFAAGDLRLGPWIYKTRSTIGRTVVNLARAFERARASDVPLLGPVLSLALGLALFPFNAFGRGYVRITQAVSRAQELAADRLSARIGGAAAAIAALDKTERAAFANIAYLRNEIRPLAEEGVLPPIGEGFAAFVANARGTIDEILMASPSPTDPLDSHPATPERIAALRELDSATREPDARPAIELVRDADALERSLITPSFERRLEPITWSDAPAIWSKRWRRLRERIGDTFAEFTVATVPTSKADLERVMREHELPRDAFGQRLTPEMVEGWARTRFGTVLAVLLLDAGFVAETPPGAPAVLRKDADAIAVFEELRDRLAGKTDDAAWRARWERLGLADARLG